MRVVAGIYGGRRLHAPRGDGTRPTSDRVREAVFSALGPLDGAVVLDLFAGTGALGIEALSRGAARALFVEQDRRALAVLRRNLADLSVPAPAAQVRGGDARAALRTARERGDHYSLVFLDPPYRLAPALGDELTDGLTGLLAPGARVVAEMDRRAPLELGLPCVLDRRYGDTLIRIHSATT
ncbi:16S rRNA (guanine(966)-N(2))-methyltransferase RsmD [Paraconexibacter algicola]|uniref:16S rRNA (Guanine(966)-N(2))-methyltransferase RsmD n=1 Tax=Paraconexibacter algicola TaxID=2133960 RepID=A0A2T4UD45_9ACTN|nr:16S rRNA (guanine(966)-N(2))-methyltransferase RsmD [Paraconexibacter algicola]PTL55420.1 16S rRNA (guanine(966)-N(2))-methyltransferase RsmD [Paraconexibacter algicola]